MAGQLDDLRVQLGVDVGGAQQVLLASAARWRSSTVAQLGGAPRDVDRGLAGREPLERGARLQDLDGLLLGHQPHARAAVRLALDQPLVLEPDQRRPHGRARQLERAAHVGLDEPLVGHQVAAQDRPRSRR